MQIIEVQQGTKLWHEHRAKHRNASDTPSVTGHSPYKSRTQFMHERKSGIIPDVDDVTQSRFDQGHRAEALARPLMEEIIGEELYPVTGTNGIWSASFDGLNMLETIAAEHKSLNDTLRKVTTAAELPIYYREQMEHQLMVCGGEKCLFMASKWNDDDTLAEEVHFWYFPDAKLRAQIVAAWDLFDKESEIYEHQEYIPAPKAEAIMQLPAVVINVTGQLVACNLAEITPRFDAFLSGAKTVLVTDEDFVNGEETAKYSRSTAKVLKLKADEVIGQIASIGDAVNTLKLYAEKFDGLGLKLEKLVKSEKDNRKCQIVTAAQQAYQAHKTGLEAEIMPLRLSLTVPNFAEAMKSKKRLDAMQDAVNTELANGKIAADTQAKDFRAKLAWIKEAHGEYGFLFRDLQAVVADNGMEAFKAIVQGRVDAHKKAESDKLEAERARIQAEATAKAEREAAEKLAQEEARIRAEERAKADAEAKAQAELDRQKREQESQAAEQERQRVMVEAAAKLPRQSDEDEQVAETMRRLNEDAQAIVIDTGATINLGEINKRLGFMVTADFLASLGFAATQVKNGKYFRECDFKAICAAIVRHVQEVAQ